MDANISPAGMFPGAAVVVDREPADFQPDPRPCRLVRRAPAGRHTKRWVPVTFWSCKRSRRDCLWGPPTGAADLPGGGCIPVPCPTLRSHQLAGDTSVWARLLLHPQPSRGLPTSPSEPSFLPSCRMAPGREHAERRDVRAGLDSGVERPGHRLGPFWPETRRLVSALREASTPSWPQTPLLSRLGQPSSRPPSPGPAISNSLLGCVRQLETHGPFSFFMSSRPVSNKNNFL